MCTLFTALYSTNINKTTSKVPVFERALKTELLGIFFNTPTLLLWY